MRRKANKAKPQYKGWRAGAAKNASKKAWEKRRERRCKYCDISLKGVSPVKPFSEVYNRMCPTRDGDLCERVNRTR